MKKVFLLIMAVSSVSLGQAKDLDLREANRISCSTTGRGSFNLVDLKSEAGFVGSRRHAMEVMHLGRGTITYVHPSGSVETLDFGQAEYSSGQLSGYRVSLSDDSGQSQSVRCSVSN